MSPAPGYRHGIINGNIYHMLKAGLKNSLCLVFMENLDFQYHPDENDDYVCPDIMVICDRKHLKGGAYSGVPKFIVETLSPSTAKRDRAEKRYLRKSRSGRVLDRFTQRNRGYLLSRKWQIYFGAKLYAAGRER